ncbi:MAG TPA: 4Fe-4S dicluster-binding protein [bacterium]|nr:4Fe-4S dicluster-binding protein [bacterium]
MARTISVEVVYRGIYQKTLAKNICRGIVLAARKEGKIGISFGRYGDSPERNGIPAKNFAIVAPNEEELQLSMAQYEPEQTDVTISVDDMLCKGVESWAWYGLQPINQKVRDSGTLIVTSMLAAEELIKFCHTKPHPYRLAVIQAIPSFSGLWVYKDDHTDARILGALPKVCPELVSLDSIVAAIKDEWKDDLKVRSARRSCEQTMARTVAPGEGNPEVPYTFDMPGWTTMREGVTIDGIRLGEPIKFGDQIGGYRPARNPYFKKFSTRTMRPVIDFDKCIKCTLCWLQCPDSCFDVTPDQTYDLNAEACCGCGVCEAVCPVDNCVTMVNEAAFTDNQSQWEAYKKDKVAYKAWVEAKIKEQPERSHGFRYRGQYQEQVAKMGVAADAGETVGADPGGQEEMGVGAGGGEE